LDSASDATQKGRAASSALISSRKEAKNAAGKSVPASLLSLNPPAEGFMPTLSVPKLKPITKMNNIAARGRFKGRLLKNMVIKYRQNGTEN
jgi:hypothetical protein